MRALACPRCGLHAAFDPAPVTHANDDEDIVALKAPSGFGKVQCGWNSVAVMLFCVGCGVAARYAGPVGLE